MNFSAYNSTDLEDWITKFYKKMEIQKPKDVDIRRISLRHDIYIHYKQMPARYDVFKRYKTIVLDARSSAAEQREQFFHELCHVLRHAGHQSMMPKAFRELQEWDANLFTMYAALPFYLVRTYDFESPYLIQNLANDFQVTESLCKKRIEHIQRNCFNHSMLVAEQKTSYSSIQKRFYLTSIVLFG